MSIDHALQAIREEGFVLVPVAAITGSVGAWLDELIRLASDHGLELTWTLRGDHVSIVDIEA